MRGRSLLLNNGTEDVPYLSCGVPRKLLDTISLLGVDPFGDALRLPERERGNAELPYNLSYAKTAAGVQVVTTNCALCHASKLGDSLVVGLGNPNLDFTHAEAAFGIPPFALDLLSLTLTRKERDELKRFTRLSDAESSVSRPDTVGVNPAGLLFGVLAAHRDATTLQWLDRAKPEAKLGVELVFTDVPAWWNLKRRDRMFYSGFGRGNQARIMMTAALMCLENTQEAAAIDAYFSDIEAFILSLRPPSCPDVAKRAIEPQRATAGRGLFLGHCARCHGDVEAGIDPRPSVSIAEVGTDPAYAISSSRQGNGAIAPTTSTSSTARGLGPTATRGDSSAKTRRCIRHHRSMACGPRRRTSTMVRCRRSTPILLSSRGSAVAVTSPSAISSAFGSSPGSSVQALDNRTGRTAAARVRAHQVFCVFMALPLQRAGVRGRERNAHVLVMGPARLASNAAVRAVVPKRPGSLRRSLGCGLRRF